MLTNRDLQLNSGMRCAKYMLVTVSAMFALTAILLIMVGTTIQTIFGDFQQFLENNFSSPPALLVAIGFILLLVAALGAYGAIQESVLLINMYGLCLFLVFILEVAAAIAAFVLQGQVREMLMRTMTYSIQNYEANSFEVDFMQRTLECCGVNEYTDWEEVANSKMPPSCCQHWSENLETGKCVAYESGCFHRLNFIISQSTMLIATGATTVAFVQLLGVFSAFMLAKTLRRNKSIREARRWQLQQSLGVLISGGKMAPPMNSPMTGYTQLEKAERYVEQQDPVTYTPASPSVN